MPLPDLGATFDSDVTMLIVYVTVMSRPEYWPDEEVQEARTALTSRYSRIPTLQDLIVRFGEGPVAQIANRVIDQRTAEIRDIKERMGIGSNCHLCGSAPSTHYEFALGTIVKTEKHWGAAAGMLALNILTVPLAGMAVGPRGVGSTTSARLSRCRLILCQRCADERKRGLFRVLTVTQTDCCRHPSWNRLIQAGNDKFFDAEALSKYH